MRRAFILNTRKRVIVALAHSAAFLAIAAFGLAGSVHPLRAAAPASAWILPGVYVLVSAVLATLTIYARVLLERLYFGCCAASAGFGLGRQVLGDPHLHFAVYVRILMLSCAIAVGMLMLRE